MKLEPGRKVGPYEIVSLAGAGGMGEVYRARDTRLERTVALKILSPGLAQTPVSRARFEREARAIAALSHPHICAIHDVGNDGGIEYLVMEYLEGETLADRLARGPLPMNLAVRYGAQIADALHHAHRAGITHRDLKPGNVMITTSGAKLLDFGLARTIIAAGSETGANAATEVAPLTADGTIVGTFQYMSPEQLEGKPLDHRTDIFTLGVVLYEMIAAQRPFDGGTKSAVATAILTADPLPLRSLQPATTPELERIVFTALEKDREDRWQTAQDMARQLRWIAEGSSTRETVAKDTAAKDTAAKDTAARSPRWIPWVIAAVLLLATAAALLWSLTRSREAPVTTSPPLRLELSPPHDVRLVSSPDLNSLAISPDGRTLAFVGAANGTIAIYLRELDSFEARKLEGSEGGLGPFWSPDGNWIGFSANGTLWKLKRSGDAPPVALAKIATVGATGSWSGSRILFGDAPESRTGIFSVSDNGGAVVPVTKASADEWRHAWPYVLPGGKHFVYLSYSNAFDRSVILAKMDGTAVATILKNVSNIRALSADELVFVKDGKLLAQRFDFENGTALGEPVQMGSEVSYFHPTARAEFDAVPAGVAVYRTQAVTTEMRIVDRAGRPVRTIDGTSLLFDVSVSPDGNTLATTLVDRDSGLADIWLYDLARGVRDRLTNDPGIEFGVLWSRDARSVVYSSGQGGSTPHIVRLPISGSGGVQELTPRGRFRYAESFSPDGAHLYFSERTAGKQTDIYRLSLATRTMEPVVVTGSSEESAQVSPDGAWLAYCSDATGTMEIYLRRLAGDGGRVRMSAEGGIDPRWSDEGELFFLGSDRRTISSVRRGPDGGNDARAERLFTATATVRDYAVLPSRKGLVVINESPGPRDDRLRVIVRSPR